MRIPYFIVNAFTMEAFGGNPAGVCPLEAWLPDATMQAIAKENGLSETAFFLGGGSRFDLRWFTPAAEVDLCGHATLASAHVLWTHRDNNEALLEFETRSGPLYVTRAAGRYVLDLPAQIGEVAPSPPGLAEALGMRPQHVIATDDILVVAESAARVAALKPDFAAMSRLDARGVIVTAPGEDCDFVSRFFAPAVGVDEDPVTGSAHCKLVPYWAERLGKAELHARQISERGGELFCELRGDRVGVAGHAVDYLIGEIALPGE